MVWPQNTPSVQHRLHICCCCCCCDNNHSERYVCVGATCEKLNSNYSYLGNHFESIHMLLLNLYMYPPPMAKVVQTMHNNNINRKMIYVYDDSEPRFYMVKFHCINLSWCANDNGRHTAKCTKYTWARYGWVQHTTIFIFFWPLLFSYTRSRLPFNIHSNKSFSSDIS